LGRAGCLFLGASARSAVPQLARLLADRQSTIRITAARALFAAGKSTEGKQSLHAELGHPLDNAEILLLINAITQIDATGGVPQAWVERQLQDQHASEYVKRFCRRVLQAR